MRDRPSGGRLHKNQGAWQSLWVGILIIAMSLTDVSGGEPNWHPVRDGDIQRLFSGREFGDGAHFSYRFRSNGTFAGTEMGRNVRGRWRTTARQFCWTNPPGAEECYEVESSGENVRLLRYGSEASFGTLSPIKAEDKAAEKTR